MSLYFVTGVAGSGKSTVRRELIARGYEAYDTDEDGYGRWRNTVTGYVHPKSSVKSADRTEAFLAQHSWEVPIEEVEKLADLSHDKMVFLCGASNNRADIKHLFKDVFALVVDEATIRQRFKTRTDNDWGKQPQEIQMTLDLQAEADQIYAKAGFVIIDSTEPINIVVDNILSKT